jgi:RNA polymerase sigma factor (sigma-70 family)
MNFNKKQTPKHYVEKMLDRALRGVAPMEHDYRVEKALIIAFQNGDEDAGFELCERYMDVFSVIINKPANAPFNGGRMRKLWDGSPNRYDYEDMFQEILYQFLLMVDEFDTGEETPFVHQARKTLHQRFFNRYFSEYIEKRNTEIELDESMDLGFTQDITLDEGKAKPEHFELYNALNVLTGNERAVIECLVVKEWNASETARELGLKPATVRKLKERGIKKLKQILIEEVA